MYLSIVLSLILNMFSISASAANIDVTYEIQNVITHTDHLQSIPKQLLTLDIINADQVPLLEEIISSVIEAANQNNLTDLMSALTSYEIKFIELACEHHYKRPDAFLYTAAFMNSDTLENIVKKLGELDLLVSSIVMNNPEYNLKKNYKDAINFSPDFDPIENLQRHKELIRSLPQRLLAKGIITIEQLNTFQESVDAIITLKFISKLDISDKPTLGLYNFGLYSLYSLYESVIAHDRLLISALFADGSIFNGIRETDLYLPYLVYKNLNSDILFWKKSPFLPISR
jgi:hypothetical protein